MDVYAVAGVQLAELLDALAADASVLVVEALLEDGREDLAERVDRAQGLEDAAHALADRLLAVADLHEREVETESASRAEESGLDRK